MIIQLENINKSYNNSDQTSSLNILNNVSLEINRKDAIAITGPSGSGKSTILNIMGTLDKPDSGIVKIDNKNISGYKDKELAILRNQKIGFVFQLHHLLPQLTLLENVLLPTIPIKEKDNAEKRAMELLKKVGLSDKIYNRPGQLSGGECQRAAVVRALINKPDILLADEPTGSLDKNASDHIGELLSEINRKEDIALVIVTHSQELAKKMDKVYNLANGIIKQQEL